MQKSTKIKLKCHIKFHHPDNAINIREKNYSKHLFIDIYIQKNKIVISK